MGRLRWGGGREGGGGRGTVAGKAPVTIRTGLDDIQEAVLDI